MRGGLLIFLIVLMFSAVSCSMRRVAVNKIGDALASGGSVYESDEDIELVAAALPFSLKLIEGLLAESPNHKGLLLTASQGFVSYAYLDVQPRVDATTDFEGGVKLRSRIRRLYLRGFNYGVRALEQEHPGFSKQLILSPRAAVGALKKTEVPLIYWTAAGLGLAISSSRDDVAMIARLPEVGALLDRALELDPGWHDGALHEFAIVLESSKPGKLDVQSMQDHYRQALAYSKGRSASLHVTLAEALAVQQQDTAAFSKLLEAALSIDPDLHTENRLMNLAAQRRARWLLERKDELILSPESFDYGARP
jgi:predicted anti-sigma-YlaC factor YlaD